MSEVASKTRQVGMARAFAVAFSLMVAVALLMTAANATLAATAPAAPVISSPAEGSNDIDGAFTLSGTAPANSAVKVFEVLSNGRTSHQGTAQVSATGAWALPLTGVANGKHAYKATVSNSEGVSDWSNTRTVTVDNIPGAPAAPSITTFLDDSKIRGTAEPNSKVELFDGTTSLGTVQADAQGNWSKEVAVPLESRAYWFKARATDLAGNVSGWSNEYYVGFLVYGFTCILEDEFRNLATKSLPTPSINFCDDGKISGIAEPNSKVELFDRTTSLGTVQADAQGNWSKKVAVPLKTWDYLFKARATNLAGNVSGWSNEIEVRDVTHFDIEG